MVYVNPFVHVNTRSCLVGLSSGFDIIFIDSELSGLEAGDEIRVCNIVR